MTVKRIVANIAAEDPTGAHGFYVDILGMEMAMDLGFIVTFRSPATTRPQISIASAGGSGTPVPDLSIEVDNLEEIHRRLIAGGYPIEHGPVDEAWGVRRLFTRDPHGRPVNILQHQ